MSFFVLKICKHNTIIRHYMAICSMQDAMSGLISAGQAGSKIIFTTSSPQIHLKAETSLQKNFQLNISRKWDYLASARIFLFEKSAFNGLKLANFCQSNDCPFRFFTIEVIHFSWAKRNS